MDLARVISENLWRLFFGTVITQSYILEHFWPHVSGELRLATLASPEWPTLVVVMR